MSPRNDVRRQVGAQCVRVAKWGSRFLAGAQALAFLAGVLTAPQASAEGSRSLYPASYPAAGFRADLDLTVDATPATAPYVGVTARRQFVYVYANAGEYILLGSSNRANGGDILVFNPQSFGAKGAETIPGTPDFRCSATTPPAGSYGGGTRGTITARANELAGPNSADNSQTVANGYSPCAYLAPATGIYGVRFTIATSGGSAPSGSVGTLHVGNATVAAWEVQVRASATSLTDINARAFTYAFVAFTGGNSRPVYHTLYYATEDGQRYRQTMQGFDPNGYALWGNASGFLDNGQPLYRDIRGGGAQVSPGTGQFIAELTAQRPEDPVFFTSIDPAGANASQAAAVLQALGIPLTPATPTILDPQFNGLDIGNQTYVGGGGTFTFTAENSTSYRIVISRDGVNFDPALATNATLAGLAPDGPVSVVWDGNANDGTPFPVGTFTFQIAGRNGEIHFPMVDAEGNRNGGPVLTKLNGQVGDATVYYDDRGYATDNSVVIGSVNGLLCPANPPVPPTPDHSLTGVDSSAQTYSGANCNGGAGTCYYRYWPNNGNANADCSGGTTGFGDAKALDLWSFQRTPTQSSTLVINPAPTAATVSTSVNVPATAYPAASVNGTVVFRNIGGTSATGVAYDVVIGTPGNCPTNLAFAPGVAFTYNAATCVVTLTGLPATLTAGQQVPLNFSYTAPASGSVPVTSTISSTNANMDTANDVTDIIVADVVTTITVPATWIAGGTVDGTIDFSNSTGATATADGVTYAATIGTPGACPAGVAFPTLPPGISAAFDATTCRVTFSGAGLPASLAPGDAFEIGFEYTGPASGSVPVSSTIATTTPQSNTANDTSNGSTLFAPPNLTLAKTGPASAVAGVAFDETIGLGNSGTVASGIVATVGDTLPAGVVANSVTPGAGVSTVDCGALPSPAGAPLTCTVALTTALPAGAPNGSASFVVNVTAASPGSITNYAAVDPTGGTTPPTPGPACAPATSCGSATTTIAAPADITLAKTGPAVAVAGGALVYTIGLGNSGDVPSATTLTVADALPPGVVFQSAAPGAGVTAVVCAGAAPLVCTVTLSALLAPGATNGTAAFTLTTTAPSNAGAIVNYASVDPDGGASPPSPGPGCTPAPSCGSATTTIALPPNITLAKAGPATALVGGPIAYTIALGNSGETASGTTITVADALPSGVVYQSAAPGTNVTAVDCTGTSLLTCTITLAAPIAAGAPNGAAAFSITVTAPATTGPIVNYASVDPDGGPSPPQPGPACAPATSCGSATTTIVTPPNITLAKSGPATATAGGTLVYTIALGNSGETASGTLLTVADLLPAGTTLIGTAPATNVTSVACSGAAPLVCSVQLTAPLPPLSANGAASFTITVQAPSTSGSITNYASTDPTGGNSPPLPGPACAPATSCGSATTTINAPVNVTLGKSGPATVAEGGALVYTIALGNSGGTPSGTTIVVADTLPAGVVYQSAAIGTNVTAVDCTGTTTLSCTLTLAAPLAAGAANGVATFTIATVAPLTPDTVTNYASTDPLGSASPPTPGPGCAPATSCGSATTTILGPVNITLEKSGPATVAEGGALVYTIALGNSGSSPSGTTIVVADFLPAGVVYQTSAPGTNVTAVDCAGTTTLTCTLTLAAPLAAGAANGAATFTIATVAPLTPDTVTNYASTDPLGGVSPPTPGPGCAPATSCGSATTTILGPVNITLGKSGPATVAEGGALVYTIALGNSGSSPSGSSIVVADTLPAGVVYQSAAIGTNVTTVDCTGTTTLSCTLTLSTPLAAGAANGAATFTITTVAPLTPDTVTNYASTDPLGGTSPPTPGPTCAPATSCGSATTTIVGPVNITLIKSGPATADENGALVYTIALGNSGSSPSGTTLTVADVLPAGVVYQSAAIGTNVAAVDCSGTTTLTCTLTLAAPLAAGAANGAATFTIATLAPGTPGTITNHAAVDPLGGSSPPTPGPGCAPATSCGSATTVIGAAATPDITLVKSGPASVEAGGALVYTIALGNSGTAASGTTLTVADVLPAGVVFGSASAATGVTSVSCAGTTTLTCTLALAAPLAAGAANGAASFTLTTTAPDAAGTIVNYASTDPLGGTSPPAPGPGCTPATSCGSATTTIVAAGTPVLTILKTGPATAVAGQTIAYTIEVRNTGSADATNAVLDDPAPAGLTFVSAASPCGGGFPCDLGTIAAGQSVTVAAVTFSIAADASGTIVNVATVSSDETGPTSWSASAVLTPGGGTVSTPVPLDARWMLALMASTLASAGIAFARRRVQARSKWRAMR